MKNSKQYRNINYKKIHVIANEFDRDVILILNNLDSILNIVLMKKIERIVCYVSKPVAETQAYAAKNMKLVVKLKMIYFLLEQLA